jgi:valyl-tRNA synthetase
VGRHASADPLVLGVAAAVLGKVRKANTAAKPSMRAEVARVVVRDTPARLAALVLVEADVRNAGRIAVLVTEEADSPSVEVELAQA